MLSAGVCLRTHSSPAAAGAPRGDGERSIGLRGRLLGAKEGVNGRDGFERQDSLFFSRGKKKTEDRTRREQNQSDTGDFR